MKFILVSICTIVLMVLQSSCRSSKNITKAIAKNDSTINVIKVNENTNNDSIKQINEVLQKMQDNFIDFNSFSGKAKIDFDAPEQKVPDLTAFIRIKKDSLIWVNLYAYEIVNAAKVLITKDSFYVIDKYHDTYMKRPISFIQEITQIPFDFTTIQNLLIGNPVYFKKPINTFKKNENTVTLLSITDLFKNLITLNNSNFLLQHSKLDDVDANRNRTCDLSYTEYENLQNKNFSKNRNIVISEKAKITIDIKFKSFKFNEDQTYPFVVPKKYKIL